MPMSLRNRLLLLFTALLAFMLALAWWGSRWLTRELAAELDRVALYVGESMVSALDQEVLAEAGDSDQVIVLVERTIESEDQTIHALHRQQGERITSMSLKVGDEPARVLDFPEPAPGERHLARVELKTVHESRSAPGSLRVSGRNLMREIPIPGQGVSDSMQRFSKRLWIGLVALFALGLAGAAFIAHRVGRPLRRLQLAARRLGGGDLGAQITDSRGSVTEVDETISAFNQMSAGLRQLEQARRELRAREHLSELGEIGRGLAHSLRNPLNAIGLALEELVGQAPDRGRALALADGARAQIRRIDRSIRSFLTLASASQAAPEPLQLNEIADDVILEALQLAGPGVEVRLEADPGIRLNGVATEVRAMLQTLVVNAVQASPPGVEVVVQIGAGDDRIRIEVCDRGPGLAPAVREKLFQPHLTTKPDGSGMGLYLTRRLAESRYRGTIELADRDGGGTVAKLELGAREHG